MKICKYCKKPILDKDIWNPDSEGNGYHHACLCEIEFRLRDRKIYNKGFTDALNKIKSEIKKMDFDFGDFYDHTDRIIEMILKLIDKYNRSEE